MNRILEVRAAGLQPIRGKLRGSRELLGPLIAARDLMRTLDFVQTQTGSPFPVPDVLTDNDRFALMLADALRRRGAAQVAWPPTPFPLEVPSARQMLANASLIAHLDCRMTLNSTVYVAGNPIVLPAEPETIATGLVVVNPVQVREQLRDPRGCRVWAVLDREERTTVWFRWRKVPKSEETRPIDARPNVGGT